MKRIQILLSTYNGEKYLREQLDSYLKLNNFSEIKVLIRDDGSTDGTVKILEGYKEKYGFELILGDNIGLADSMFELMRNCDMECEYFSFSDQDDVWLPEKLERAVAALDKESSKIPLLYSARSFLTDSQGNVYSELEAPKRKISFYNAMLQNVCAGHTQVCNRTLLQIVRTRYSDKIFVIDFWFYMIATAIGNVIFDNQCTTLYRQHGNNTLGHETGFIKKNVNRIKRLKNNEIKNNAIMLKDMYKLYSDVLPDEYKIELNNFFAMQKNFFKRFRYILSTKAYRQSSYEDVVFRFLYLKGEYNTD